MTSSAGISHPGLGAFPPPALQTFPQAVTSNVAIARTRTRSWIMAVVKADGYGHGATVAHAAIAAGAEWLGTTDIAEASKLRAAGLTVPILTWLNPSGVDAEAAATDQIDVAVGSVDELEALLKHAASRVPVHLNLAVVDVADEEAARLWAGKIAVACGWPQEVRRFRYATTGVPTPETA